MFTLWGKLVSFMPSVLQGYAVAIISYALTALLWYALICCCYYIVRQKTDDIACRVLKVFACAIALGVSLALFDVFIL